MLHKKILKVMYFSVLGVVLFFWIKTSYFLFEGLDIAAVLLGVARLFGLLAAFCVLTQFLLIGRIKWIERAWGHDKLARIHKKNGKLILYFILIHFFTVVLSYSMTSKVGFIQQLLDFFEYYDDALNAFIGFLLFVTVALTSIFISRLKWKYETWYFVHFLTYLAILFAWGHQLKLGGSFTEQFFYYYWVALYSFVAVNFLFFRFTVPVYHFFKYRFRIVKVVSEEGNATSIYIGGQGLEKLKREAGQFIIVRFLDWKRFWQAHPFSLSWGPQNNLLRLTIKDSGDFTHEINSLQVGTPVYIDGPHGRFTPENNQKKFLFIVGGIGITPVRSMLEALGNNHDSILLWSNKERGEVPLLKEVKELSKKNGFPLYLFYTEETKKMKGDFVGRVDEKALSKLVPNLKDREVYLCGPEAFMFAMIDVLKAKGVPEESIHYEIFSFR